MALSHKLIFLRGWGTSSGVWKHQMEYFSTKCRIETPSLYPDLSTINYKPSTILIGWSYGGMLSIQIASKAPDKLKALVLVGCSAKFSGGIHPTVIKNLIRNLNRDFAGTMRNCYGAFFSNEESDMRSRFIKEQLSPDKKITVDILNELARLDLRKDLKYIDIPTLIIHGDKDEICPIGAGRFLHGNIKDSRLEVLRGAGHMPFYTRPEEFNKILEDFISGVK